MSSPSYGTSILDIDPTLVPNVSDVSTAFQALITGIAAGTYPGPAIIPWSNLPWLFGTAITNPNCVPVVMHGAGLLFTGSGADAYTHGNSGSSGTPTLSNITVQSPALSIPNVIKISRYGIDFSDVHSGIVLLNCNGQEFVVDVQGFYYGLQLLGDSSGTAYNQIHVGIISNAVKYIVLHAKNEGWVNENKIYGGSTQNHGNPTTSDMTAGVLWWNETPSPMTGNMIFGASFENDAEGPATCHEFRMPVGAAGFENNRQVGARCEGPDYFYTGDATVRYQTTGTTNGTTTLTVASSAGFSIGALVTSSSGDLPAGTYVTTFTGTTVTLSAAATGSHSGQTITVRWPESVVVGMVMEWLDVIPFHEDAAFNGCLGATAQDTLALQLITTSSPSAPIIGQGHEFNEIVGFGRANVVTANSGKLQAPSRGGIYDGTNFVDEITGALASDEIQLTSNGSGMGVFLDLRRAQYDVFKKVVLCVNQGSGSGTLSVLVKAWAANGTTELKSLADVMGSSVMGSGNYLAVFPGFSAFIRNSNYPGAGLDWANYIAFGSQVAFAYVSVFNPYSETAPTFRKLWVDAPSGSRIVPLFDSTRLSALGAAHPLIDSDRPRSKAIPGSSDPHGQTAVPHGSVVASGSPMGWMVDSSGTWKTIGNLP